MMKGVLKSFGSNGNGQLGLGHEEDTHIPTRCVVPTDFPANSPPKCIVAGGNHTLVLFPCGRLFATGLNNYGQCGISPATAHKFDTFHEVPAPPPEDGGTWELVSAGWEFSVLVSTTGKIYVCGFGGKGELGLGAQSTTITDLQAISKFTTEKIVQIASGMAHTLVVLSSGEVWGWGTARKGQLGVLSPAEKMLTTPRRIQIDFPVARAVCGREFSFVVDHTGERHCMLGVNGRFGLLEQTPKAGELRGYKRVGAAWGSVLVLMADGSLVAWGRDDRGQLPPAGLESVHDLAVGSEHALAVAGGQLVCWGWGEHGNCGKPRSQDGGDVRGEVFAVDAAAAGRESNSRLAAIGAGCATSWVWVEGEAAAEDD
ncbi:regulator of chromosome condensation 1/beta-lactamase-inhibitor protein II [Sphaerosporella brunnea]|uniref:Regulator of chromosome condensation 1/beta-lactamase-inhibitor protein II n=1 Tax=Sphaerosporella brunnea TaxID=1250544 RepID=A0A5J5F510_9PEZI|nr:regulator of chromosome condensation 1/beta-lactamase-inhibitor protein II [Sphaerosporella brunnea]